MSTRRTILAMAGLTALGFISLNAVRRVSDGAFEFCAIEGLDGFRLLETGQFTAPLDPFVGLQAPSEPQFPAPEHIDPCGDLFAYDAIRTAVPMAIFSDFNCPICRRQTQDLQRYATKHVSMSWHELPLLGDDSVQAAVAAVAAGQQGAYQSFHKFFLASRAAPDPAQLRALSREFDLDAERLIGDLQSQVVLQKIGRSMALAELFGFYATPAMVVGRTAVLGYLEPARLDKLIAIERDLPPVCAP